MHDAHLFLWHAHLLFPYNVFLHVTFWKKREQVKKQNLYNFFFLYYKISLITLWDVKMLYFSTNN